MPKFCDLTGRQFGRLTVLRHVGRTKSKKQLWECACTCGNISRADGGSLVCGDTTSCGCYLKERITKHGGWQKGSYNTWRAMMRRCYTATDKDYPKYGGVGISVHAPWHEYTTFAMEMGEPEGSQTLDRKDPYGGYTPQNCRWASPTEQARNRRAMPSKSGHLGVYLVDGPKWMAAITVRGKKYYGKCRDTLEAAKRDRVDLERTHWGEGC